jgi:dGTPase
MTRDCGLHHQGAEANRDLDAGLAPYAARHDNSRGRLHPESSPPYRSEFQRDRDRIVHCAAFRRLEYKTQVFVNHEGDLFRTRLTHSLEVAQIARSVARALRLNEDLTEAIALAHDLGHTPFGHAGQDALNACMADYGGFEHNLQSLRVVGELEAKYADFPGLNLTYETREGVLKHCSLNNARGLGVLGERFIYKRQSGLEAQLSDIADEIAYNNHDVDDGLRAGLIRIHELRGIDLFNEHFEQVRRRYPGLAPRRTIHEVVRRMINRLAVDLIETSQARILECAPRHIEDVREHARPLMGFSDAVHAQGLELKRFLRDTLYRHYRVHRMSAKARRIVTGLFQAFMEDPKLLPGEYRERSDRLYGLKGERGRARAVADYIAGMTDRYAIKEHDRLFDPKCVG